MKNWNIDKSGLWGIAIGLFLVLMFCVAMARMQDRFYKALQEKYNTTIEILRIQVNQLRP